jgi:hypothetical protein
MVIAALTLAGTLSSSDLAAEVTKNGFDLDGALVPVREIVAGGPPRDGIPAIDDPQFRPASDPGEHLDDDDRVLGVERNGEAKAYPIAILNYHEIVNDTVGGEPVVVTYCPLCGSGMVFLATIDGERRFFGVSGLLYNSDVLLYDRASDSLFSQLLMRAVTGPLEGASLQMVAASHTTWADWRRRHPDTRVLSTETGHARDYRRNPYPGYESSRTVFFPVSTKDRRYHPKERVLGLVLDGVSKGYPFVELGTMGGPVEDQVGGQSLTVLFDTEHQTARIVDESGDELPTVVAYWFAWRTFHPEAEVFVAP